jgi:chemotaxis signal transduction protein
MKIMTFHLPDCDCAVELSSVVEVVRRQGAAGATLADRALPLLDLADRLGLEGGIREDAPAVVLRSAAGQAGMRVERLGEVVEVGEGQIRRLPRYFAHPLMRGVAEVEGRLVVLLDADRLVAAGRAGAGE